MEGWGPYQQDRYIYDAKRMRKPLNRKMIDISSLVINDFQNRLCGAVGLRDGPVVQPHSSYRHRTPLPCSLQGGSIADSICARNVKTSVNKVRCPVNVCQWIPSGKRIITGNTKGEFTLWNGAAFNFETILQAHDYMVLAMAWSHNGNFLISGDDSGIIKYWELTMTNLQAIPAHGGSPVRALSFAPSDSKFVSCSDDATVRLWDWEAMTEEHVLSGHGWDVTDVQWHPFKSLIASGSKDSVLKLWDPKAGTSLATLFGHKNHINKVRWNQNGNWLVSASNDGLIKLYDIRSMRELTTLKGHGSQVTSLSWHPFHERLLVSGGKDGTLIYWIIGLDNAQEVIEFAHEQAIRDIDWHPAGHIVATGSSDHATKFWCRNRPGDTFGIMNNLNKTEEKKEKGTTTAVGHKRPLSEIRNANIPGLGGQLLPDQAAHMVLPSAAAPVSSQEHVVKKQHQQARIDAMSSQHRGFPGRFHSEMQSRRFGPVPDSYTCVKCGVKGHWVEVCPKMSMKGPPPDYVCFGCQAQGQHWRVDCPVRAYRGGGRNLGGRESSSWGGAARRGGRRGRYSSFHQGQSRGQFDQNR